MTQPVVVRTDIAGATVWLTPSDGPTQTIHRARVIVTDERVYVFVDSSKGPVERYSARIASYEGRNTTGWQVVTASGDSLTFKRAGGCMCGSQLKGFRPFAEGMVQGAYTDQ